MATRGAAWLASDDSGAPPDVGAGLAFRTTFTANAADTAGPAIFALRRHIISLVNSTIPDATAGTSPAVPVVDPPRTDGLSPPSPDTRAPAAAPSSAADAAAAPMGRPTANRRLHLFPPAPNCALRPSAAADGTAQPCPSFAPRASLRDLPGTSHTELRVIGYRGESFPPAGVRGLKQAGARVSPAVAVAVVSRAVAGEPASEVYAEPPLPVLMYAKGQARTARAFSAGEGITREDDAWAGQVLTPSLLDDEYVARYRVRCHANKMSQTAESPA